MAGMAVSVWRSLTLPALLSPEVRELGGEGGDLPDGAQDVLPLLGVLRHVGDPLGLGEQGPDVLLSFRPPVGVRQPALQTRRSNTVIHEPPFRCLVETTLFYKF